MAEHANDDHHVALSYAEACNGNEPRPGDRVSDAGVPTTAPGPIFLGTQGGLSESWTWCSPLT